jgi:hypothetical protein
MEPPDAYLREVRISLGFNELEKSKDIAFGSWPVSTLLLVLSRPYTLTFEDEFNSSCVLFLALPDLPRRMLSSTSIRKATLIPKPVPGRTAGQVTEFSSPRSMEWSVVSKNVEANIDTSRNTDTD